MMKQRIKRPARTATTSKDSLNTMRLRVLTFLALMASVSASRNYFNAILNKATKRTSSRCIPFVGGCSLATSSTSSQSVLNQQKQEQLLLSLRAGYQDQNWQDSSAEDEVEEDEEDEEEDSYSCQPPSIALEEMAMALRWTGELNRRMIASTTTAKGTSSSNSIMSLPLYPSEDTSFFSLRGGEMVKTAEQQQQQQSKPESLTIFHAKTPFNGNQEEKPRRGALRWGPDLEAYLEHLVEDVFELTGERRSLALSLAMMYMDRATSVETPRQCPSCPFCTPRTVHRLILTSLYLAVQAILQQQRAMNDGGGLMSATAAEQQALLPPLVLPRRGRCLFYETKMASLGIPQEEMHHMLEWMKTALGDPGFFVTSDHMREWRKTWERSWFTNSTMTTPKTPIKNHGGLQDEAAPEMQQEQRSTAASAATFVPDQNHYDSFQQQHLADQPAAAVNRQYDDSMLRQASPPRPIPPPPPRQREQAGGSRRPVASTAF